MTYELMEVDADGVRLAVLVRGTGPLVICVHGFPDTPLTWSALADMLVTRGYQVALPYLRGYPPSESPADGDCSGARLGEDVLAVADALGATQFCIVGHDWGALAGYAAANLAPERIEKLITLAIPHSRAIVPNMALFRKSYHFFTLPLPGAARRLRRRNFAGVAQIYRRWSPTWHSPEEDIRRAVELMRPPGAMESTLGTYRSFLGAPWSARVRRTQEVLFRTTSVPTLTLVGSMDGALDPESIHNTPDAFTGPYSFEVFEGLGHFLHREAPERVLPAILSFLTQDLTSKGSSVDGTPPESGTA